MDAKEQCITTRKGQPCDHPSFSGPRPFAWHYERKRDGEMTRIEKFERQRALIIKHYIRRCKRHGKAPQDGIRLPALVAASAKVRRKLLQTGAVEMWAHRVPFGLKKYVLWRDYDAGTAIVPAKTAKIICELRKYMQEFSDCVSVPAVLE